MTTRLRVLFVLLVLAPLAALAWVGIEATRGEAERGERAVRALLRGVLEGHAGTANLVIAELERQLLTATQDLPRDADAIRALGRRDERMRRLLLVSGRGRLLFPPIEGPSSEEERRLIERTRPLWERGVLSHPPRSETKSYRAGQGWYSMEQGDGTSLLFWRHTSDGNVAAVEIPGALVLARIIAKLPYAGGAAASERVALLDHHRRPVYQWGTWEPPPGASSLASVALAPPLDSWQLAHMGPRPVLRGSQLGTLAGLLALALVLAGTVLWTYRESRRELRLAAQRVSFVNQVSHELKTPLTSIRMYAELLEDHLAPEDAEGQKRLDVIVRESERLSRLIQNILAFARKQKGTLSLHRAPGNLDDIVARVAAQLAPSLMARGMVINHTRGAPREVEIDADAVSQILGNLLSNVEKYAPQGDLAIRTGQDNAAQRASVVVQDAGPGIPAAERERIFEPFVRLGNNSHEGVPGTGIGLAIARDLARLHGGDLKVLQSDRGACFELTIATKGMS